MPQRIAAMHVLILLLPQYCTNADVACNALQHCYNTYCHNTEPHCCNSPFVASLQQCLLVLPQNPNIFQMCAVIALTMNGLSLYDIVLRQ